MLEIKNDNISREFLDYKKFLELEYLTKIDSIIKLLENNFKDIKFNESKYYVIEREFHIKTNKNTTIIFDLDS
ncbi:hypothetical protein HOG21_05660 [bacterium]|jgi:hypothetical protein|nr:hypothetical protein [bacterium]